MNHNVFYTAGVACGLFVGLMLVAVIYSLKIKKNTGCEFDERQQLMRGKAFKYGFIAMLVYLFTYGILTDMAGFSFGDNLTPSVIAVLVGVGTFATVCIWKDAYFALQEKAKPFILLDFLLMLINFINAYSHLRDSSRKTNAGYLNLATALVLLCILITMGVKTISEKRHVEME